MQDFLPDSILQSFSPTPHVMIESSLAGRTLEVIKNIHLHNKQLCIVCDTKTYEALGKRIHEELAGISAQLLMLETPRADEETVNVVRGKSCEAWIAVGSGTISDLCKYASFLEGKPYALFPTAPSMNGYLSANASITVKGHKQTFPAHLPSGTFCDLRVLAAAPPRLILSGFGDLLCRSTAQADWFLSHLLLDTAYNTTSFDWLKPYEDELFEHADKLVSGDTKIIHLLISALLVSGLGMVLEKGSYPASQGEHLIAHTMEMMHNDTLLATYHGEQIGVTTLSMAKIQQDILSRPLRPVLHNPEQEKAAVNAYFGVKLQDSVWQGYEPKITPQTIEKINARIVQNEQEIRENIRNVSIPAAQLESVLEKAGAPFQAEALGWKKNDYNQAIAHARFIRNRFTFLDLLT